MFSDSVSFSPCFISVKMRQGAKRRPVKSGRRHFRISETDGWPLLQGALIPICNKDFRGKIVPDKAAATEHNGEICTKPPSQDDAIWDGRIV